MLIINVNKVLGTVVPFMASCISPLIPFLLCAHCCLLAIYPISLIFVSANNGIGCFNRI